MFLSYFLTAFSSSNNSWEPPECFNPELIEAYEAKVALWVLLGLNQISFFPLIIIDDFDFEM